MHDQNEYTIVEHSLLAKIAASKLKSKKAAMVLGRKILLYGASKEEFLANERWLKHELEHIKQYKQHGFFGFIVKYLIESLLKGYHNNKYEIEARAAETNTSKGFK